MAEERCPHLRVRPVKVSVRLCLSQVQVPEYPCEFGGAVLPHAVDGGPAIAYGPDGHLVSRETCTPQRLEQRCRPALSKPETERGPNTRAGPSEGEF